MCVLFGSSINSGSPHQICLGGADTTVSAINTFLLMMVCHPEIQNEAQEELDRVIGKGQLPDFTDESTLPFISALVKETLRSDTYQLFGFYCNHITDPWILL